MPVTRKGVCILIAHYSQNVYIMLLRSMHLDCFAGRSELFSLLQVLILAFLIKSSVLIAIERRAEVGVVTGWLECVAIDSLVDQTLLHAFVLGSALPGSCHSTASYTVLKL